MPLRPLRALCFLLLVLVAAAPARAEGDLGARWERLRGTSVKRLHELIDWCGSKKLFGSRSHACEGLLTIAPDDAAARKWLKYKRSADGTWQRKGKWKRPRNLAKGKDDFDRKRAELGAWFLKAAAPILEAAEEDRAYRLRAKLVTTALALDPENETFREWNQEVRDGGKDAEWILVETKNARARRPGLKETADKAVAALPDPKQGEQTTEDRIGKVSWTAVLEGARVRVLGTPDAEELVQLMRHVDATWPVLKYAFGLRPAAYPSGGRYSSAQLTIYSFYSQQMANAFYRAQPGVTERKAEFIAPLVGSWIPKRSAVLCKSPSELTRLEAGPSQVLGYQLSRLLGLNRKHAWIAEGMGIYLTWQITNTRLLYSVNDVETKYAEKDKPIPDYEKRMNDSTANWLHLARALLKSPDRPEVHLMTGKDYNTLTKPEVLYGYCVSAYVVEGWPEKAVAFLREAGGSNGNDLDLVCLKTLGFDAAAMEARMLRWLRETRKF